MKANTIKTQIIEMYPQFGKVAGAADVKATIRGQEYKVVIKKGEAQKVMSNRKSVWIPDADSDILGFLDSLIHPSTKKKTDIVKKEESTTLTVLPEKKEATSKKKEKVPRQIVDDKWVTFLREEANKSDQLDDGDTIDLRVATSHGKPVCAHVDMLRDGKKIMTAGTHNRVGFATRGVTDKWKDQIEVAIKVIYKKLGDATIIRKGDSKIKLKDGKVVNASGSISHVLDMVNTLRK